jgi:hypothetical protein
LAKSAFLTAVTLAIVLLSAAPPTVKKTAVKTAKTELRERKLIVISIDGLDSRFFRDAERFHTKIPTLRKLIATGISADVVTVVPGLTWPAHAVIATGVPPEENGVPENERAGKPDERYWNESDLKALPIWRAAAEQRGLKTGTIYWPTTLGAHVDFNCPEYWQGKAENAIDFDQVTGSCTPGLIDRVAKWDNSFVAPLWDDAIGIDVLRFLLTKENLDLILLHLPDLAAEEHETGAMSIFARKVLESDDELLGNALQRMAPGTVVAITSDHGFDSMSWVLRPKMMLKAAGLSDTVSVSNGLIGTTSPRAAALLRKSIAVPRSGIAREVPMAEVRKLAPDLRHWVAAFDTTAGYIPNEETRGPAVSAGSHKGVRGMWPTHDSSRAVFILSGPGVKHARAPEISILDEAPTFAEILGLKLPQAKGTSVLNLVSRQ